VIQVLTETPGYYENEEESSEKAAEGENEKEKETEKRFEALDDKPPKLTILTHGHGGNLVLNMVHACEKLCKEEEKKKGSEKVEKESEIMTGENAAGKKTKVLTRVARRSISVSKLVLLACPILDEKKNLAADKMFKHVYSLYSDVDLIQILGSSNWWNVPLSLLNFDLSGFDTNY